MRRLSLAILFSTDVIIILSHQIRIDRLTDGCNSYLVHVNQIVCSIPHEKACILSPIT